jgi:uncharacterized membrane protein
MRCIVLPLFLICILGWALEVSAQSDANLEPNIMPAPPNNTWPLEVTVPGTEAAQSERIGSVLGLCTSRLGKWPEPIEEACRELILDAVRTDRLRLKAIKDSAQFRSEHTKAVLVDQRAHSVLVFWLVVVVITVGLTAAVAQFVRSFYVKGDTGSAEIAISNNEFKFRTTWLGALLLGMAMGFLFLYVVYVYPVRFVGS